MTTRHLCGWTRKTTPEKRRSFYSGTILDSKNLSLAPKIKVWVWIFPLKISFLTRIKKIHWDNLFVSPWLNFWWWKLHPKYFELKWESALDRIQFHHGEPRKKWYSLVMPSLPLHHSKWTQIFWVFLNEKMLSFVLRIREFLRFLPV